MDKQSKELLELEEGKKYLLAEEKRLTDKLNIFVEKRPFSDNFSRMQQDIAEFDMEKLVMFECLYELAKNILGLPSKIDEVMEVKEKLREGKKENNNGH